MRLAGLLNPPTMIPRALIPWVVIVLLLMRIAVPLCTLSASELWVVRAMSLVRVAAPSEKIWIAA